MAELIAEETKRTLLRISCGDLGRSPYEIDRRLQTLLKLASQSAAIVLIDEADTFLAKRSTGGSHGDYYHNATVSIFLKHLEYFPGVIFLTTNQETEFDDAVTSRAVCIRYSPLDNKSRAKIWKNHFRKHAKTHAQTNIEAICNELGNNYKLDGREIKNLAQLSLAICRRRKQELSLELIQNMYDLTHGSR
jgi:SpoVK/Ycf46/Vps4 family AAA+-type ATPase